MNNRLLIQLYLELANLKSSKLAEEFGIGISTARRWAQNPTRIPKNREEEIRKIVYSKMADMEYFSAPGWLSPESTKIIVSLIGIDFRRHVESQAVQFYEKHAQRFDFRSFLLQLLALCPAATEEENEDTKKKGGN